MSRVEGKDVISGQEFDTPLILKGTISTEPERYVAEKPYELTKYEFSVLRKRFTSEMWFQLIAGGTAGLLIAVLGKAVSALLDKQNPNFEKWEVWALVIGAGLSLISKFALRTKEDIEKEELEKVIESHFKTNRPRRIHLTQREEENEN